MSDRRIEAVIKYLEGYYSATYNQVKKRAVMEYLEKRIDKQIPLLVEKVLATFSDRWNKVPGVAEFEEAIKSFDDSERSQYKHIEFMATKVNKLIEAPDEYRNKDEGVVSEEEIGEYFKKIKTILKIKSRRRNEKEEEKSR